MRRRGRSWRAVLIVPFLAVIVVLYAFPIYWLIVTSLKSRAQLFQATLSLFPEAPTLQPYTDVLIDRGMWILLRNSIVVCGATVVLALAVGLLITYPITRLDVSPRVRAGVLNWALSLRFLPPIAVVVPYFAVVRTVGLYDQPLALIFIYSLFNLPFTIWMLKGFLTEIPREIEEAAFADGASRLTAFRHILLPLATPGLLAAGVVVFSFSWSEFLFALILTSTPNAQTFPVGVQGLVTQFEIIWTAMAASGAIAMLLPLVLMARGGRHVLPGLTFGLRRGQ